MAQHAMKVWNFPGEDSDANIGDVVAGLALLQDIRNIAHTQLTTLQQINAKLDAVIQGDGAALRHRPWWRRRLWTGR